MTFKKRKAWCQRSYILPPKRGVFESFLHVRYRRKEEGRKLKNKEISIAKEESVEQIELSERPTERIEKEDVLIEKPNVQKCSRPILINLLKETHIMKGRSDLKNKEMERERRWEKGGGWAGFFQRLIAYLCVAFSVISGIDLLVVRFFGSWSPVLGFVKTWGKAGLCVTGGLVILIGLFYLIKWIRPLVLLKNECGRVMVWWKDEDGRPNILNIESSGSFTIVELPQAKYIEGKNAKTEKKVVVKFSVGTSTKELRHWVDLRIAKSVTYPSNRFMRNHDGWVELSQLKLIPEKKA
ncbi:MAG: hypothetical protein G01um101418_777 [Parcubacteria group bacterium Gr01-1014_18]|nr:MAG: hypothetical protein Greene041636_753 [Parcubacteria group bacterium Greene0416_36]TSC80142.1 MAG: hypothetical protein G01um101418_777 [Parcubacteria group bacterium Gr01-1014_18]TSC99356.1 MAG: hypothetical protein Greene101420_284 [Parcubacteria group bacterium Greene1014_20]TSD06807.1 MAG: hypothetical protein Greene07142_541 [Parcubacteria group bacterium Greene0714_2]